MSLQAWYPAFSILGLLAEIALLVILLVRRQIAHGPECIIEKLCHGHSVARPDWEKHTATTKTPVTALGGLCMLTVRSAPHESVFGGTGDAA